MARQMKDSGVEWIGEIPEDTKLIQLRYIADITTGNMDTQNREDDGEYPFYVRSPKVERSNQYSFDDVEAILMAGDGVGAGRVFHYVQGKYACHQRVYRMNDFRYVQSLFLKYYLEVLFPMIMDQGSAKSTVDSVRLPMLQEFKVVVFNEAEQQKITDFLDEKVEEIDSVIAKIKETIEDYKKYKQAIITDAVTKGLNPDVEMRESGIEWIGQIPKHWQVSTVGKSIKFEGGSQPPVTEFINEPKEGYIRLIQNRDYKTDAYATYIPISAANKLCDKQDVMVGRYGPPVFVLHRGLKGAYNVAIMKAVPKGIDREWMFFILQEYTMLQYIESFSKRAAGQSGVNPEILRKYPLPIPPKQEQKEIAIYLAKKCSEMDKLIAKKEELLADLEDYKKSLIYEYVTGKKEVE